MKKFIQLARQARSMVEQQHAKEAVYKLLWLQKNPEWETISWRKFYAGRKTKKFAYKFNQQNTK